MTLLSIKTYQNSFIFHNITKYWYLNSNNRQICIFFICLLLINGNYQDDLRLFLWQFMKLYYFESLESELNLMTNPRHEHLSWQRAVSFLRDTRSQLKIFLLCKPIVPRRMKTLNVTIHSNFANRIKAKEHPIYSFFTNPIFASS